MKRLLAILPIALGFAFAAASPAAARNYDCSKAGNANKTVCKSQAPTPAATPATAPTAGKMPAERHYDCSKAGNADKAVCKSATPPSAPPPAPTASSRPSAPPPSNMAPRSPSTNTTSAAGPNGASAMCGDGTYSHSVHRSGTCSRHGGVKTWY